MKKDITMHKQPFVKGAFITTFGIVITKALGVVYVIPFHSVIGDEGGALYGYAYTIYLFFLSITTAGIPLAISRLVSEYQTLGYYHVKKRAFQLGKKLSIFLGLFSFLFVFLLAPFLAKMILGGVSSPEHLKDVSFVIRVVSTCFLIAPILSVYRGYFEGHRIMSPPSISQVLEQFIRVSIILIGCFLIHRFFLGKVKLAVGLALGAGTVGGIISYFYLVDKYLKNKSRFSEKIRDVNEPLVTNKAILKKIVLYAVPFIMIDIFKSFYNYIDMFTVVKGLVHHAQYTSLEAETIYSMLSTWAQKFNMIVLSVSSGIIVSLIPNLTESILKDKKKEISDKICMSFHMIFYVCFPITLGVCFLSNSIWTLFYGQSLYGPSVLSFYIFVGLASALFTTVVVILQTLKDYRSVFITLIVGVFLKLLLNIRLLQIFTSIGLPPYYGFIAATLLGYLVSFIVGLTILKHKYGVDFEEVIRNLIDIVCGSFLMILVLILVGLLVPTYSSVRLYNIFIILLYGLIGAGSYFYYCYRTRLTSKIFGNQFFQRFLNQFLNVFIKNK